VYFFDNCECPNCTIEQLAEDFSQVLNLIRYDNGEPVPRVDVVAHSMGGLIVAYLAGKQAVRQVLSVEQSENSKGDLHRDAPFWLVSGCRPVRHIPAIFDAG
jgi:pimeloyl-ACP methyl ester carboxylesterase